MGWNEGPRAQAVADRAPAAFELELIEDLDVTTDPEGLSRQVVLRAIAETGSDRGVLSWIDGDEMVVACSHDPSGELVPVGSRWPLGGEHVTALAMARNRPFAASYDELDVTGLSAELTATYRGLHSMLVAPVRSGGEDVAVICVSRRRAEEYSPADSDALARVAADSAAALRTARLQERLDAALAELRDLAAETESSERVKTDVLRLASHELRTPLTVLNGYLSLVHSGFFGPLPEVLKGVMDILQRRTAEMNSLVNDMLMAARIDDHPAVEEDEVADLRDLLQIALQDVTSRIRPDHRLEVALPDAPVMVRVDQERVVLALRNIIDNAVKYSPGGGDIRCEVLRDEQQARIRIVDHGLGIAPEDRDKLFTRFGRVLTTANSHIPGIGLGLYFSREVARRHGGDVALADAEGPGSVFELSLPTLG